MACGPSTSLSPWLADLAWRRACVRACVSVAVLGNLNVATGGLGCSCQLDLSYVKYAVLHGRRLLLAGQGVTLTPDAHVRVSTLTSLCVWGGGWAGADGAERALCFLAVCGGVLQAEASRPWGQEGEEGGARRQLEVAVKSHVLDCLPLVLG